MPTLTEESPDYPEKVAAFLAKSRRRSLPWGFIVVGSQLTLTKGTAEVTARHEMGETAIRVLNALGITDVLIDYLANLPFNTPPAELVSALERLKAEADSIES